jgi:hypothetical protein
MMCLDIEKIITANLFTSNPFNVAEEWITAFCYTSIENHVHAIYANPGASFEYLVICQTCVLMEWWGYSLDFPAQSL